jgi:hypothetical protein
MPRVRHSEAALLAVEESLFSVRPTEEGLLAPQIPFGMTGVSFSASF